MATERTIFLCRPCLEENVCHIIPVDCTVRKTDNGTEYLCPNGHSVWYVADYGEMDIGIIPNSTGSNS